MQFPEGDGGNTIIEQTFTGPLHEQLRAALRYIRNTLITEQIVKNPDRAEVERFFNYPYAAVEEALSNAVYHKGYDEREPIEVRVEKDMIEIISHPGPDRSVTLDGLRTFKVRSRRYRNRRIGEFLKELHLTEGRNTGFKKILDALRQNGSPLPEFETNEAHDYFIARLFIRDGFSGNTEGASSRIEDEPVNEPVNAKNRLKHQTDEPVNGPVNEPVNEPVKLVYSAICGNPGIRKPSIAVMVGKNPAMVKRAISRLKELGKIEFRGAPKSGGYYPVEKT